jgi:hypothetical protein
MEIGCTDTPCRVSYILVGTFQISEEKTIMKIEEILLAMTLMASIAALVMLLSLWQAVRQKSGSCSMKRSMD